MNRTTLTSAGPYISAGIVTATENCCGDGEKCHVKLNKSFKDTCHFHHVYPPPSALLHSLVNWAGSLREEVFIFVQEQGLFLFSCFVLRQMEFQVTRALRRLLDLQRSCTDGQCVCTGWLFTACTPNPTHVGHDSLQCCTPAPLCTQ